MEAEADDRPCGQGHASQGGNWGADPLAQPGRVQADYSGAQLSIASLQSLGQASEDWVLAGPGCERGGRTKVTALVGRSGLQRYGPGTFASALLKSSLEARCPPRAGLVGPVKAASESLKYVRSTSSTLICSRVTRSS